MPKASVALSITIRFSRSNFTLMRTSSKDVCAYRLKKSHKKTWICFYYFISFLTGVQEHENVCQKLSLLKSNSKTNPQESSKNNENLLMKTKPPPGARSSCSATHTLSLCVNHLRSSDQDLGTNRLKSSLLNFERS